MTSSPRYYSIEIADRDTNFRIPEAVLRLAVETTLIEERVPFAEISLVLTGDSEIHRVNRDFLGHDYPTDVISFRLDDESSGQGIDGTSTTKLEGELVISLETAARAAADAGWSLESEVVLYVVHGLLHLCGYDDLSDQPRLIMRRREREILSLLGRIPVGAAQPD